MPIGTPSFINTSYNTVIVHQVLTFVKCVNINDSRCGALENSLSPDKKKKPCQDTV
ncbi:MAG: hypothetical protein KH036_00185 [Clostridiales bacterium]|nr:hypothetical protein [Clostridiales bacterium]